MLLAMARYGAYTTVSTVGTLLLNQGPVLLIGRLLSALSVGLYSLPVRLLATMTDAVAQVAMVTVASSADLAARGDLVAIGRLAVVVNRYCLALFLPLTILLWVYGVEIFRLWVGPDVAAGSAPLLPILVLGASFGVAGQQNSNAVLFGLGKHRGFAYGLMVEGLLCIAGLAYVLPRDGLLAGVALSTMLLLVNRGLWAPWLMCRYTLVPFVDYMREIYLWPMVTAAPILLGAYLLKLAGVQGSSLPEIALAAVLVGVTYYALAIVLCLQPDHRASLQRWIRRRRPWRSAVAALAPGK
jgi:O-antigen/teichoic acid export membrane protein